MKDQFIIIKEEKYVKEKFKKILKKEGHTMSSWISVQIRKKINKK